MIFLFLWEKNQTVPQYRSDVFIVSHLPPSEIYCKMQTCTLIPKQHITELFKYHQKSNYTSFKSPVTT